MGDLRLNEISYSGNGTGVLMLNGVNYTGVPQYTELSTSGEFCSFDTDVVVPLKKAVFDIDSSASSIKVTAQSPNFFNEDTELGRINDTTGQPTGTMDVFRSKTFSPCIGGMTYYVYVGCGQNIRVYWYASDESFISVTNDVSNASITAPANAAYLKMRSTTTYGTTYLGDISINPVNDHEYHPYVEPVKQTINLGSTRTGGFVTVSFAGGCSYDDGAGNVTTLTAINPIMQVYGSNLVYCDTGDTEVTYRVAYASGGGGIPGCGYTLFKDGEFYNTDIMEIEPTTYTIEDGMIKVAQQSINGFVVSTSTLADPYIMVFTFEVTSNTSYTQCGRCVVGGDLAAMVQSGTGRYSYNNSSSNANEERTISQKVSTGGQGVFLSVGGVEAYIKEIAIFPSSDSVDSYTS